jgi:hypothetical protein
VDSGGDSVLVGSEELAAAMKARRNSYWILLATAAGESHSVAESTDGVSRRELDRGSLGAAVSPSIVDARIEAIAAYDPCVVAELARAWRAPGDVIGDPFWLSAWRTSLRHLKTVGGFNPDELASPDLDAEIEIVWGAPVDGSISWADTKARVQAGRATLADIRRWSKRRLCEPRLGARDMSDAPPVMLRLLRDRANLLDPSAAATVGEWAETLLDRDPFDASAIIEVAQAGGVLCRDLACKQLASHIDEIEDARTIIPLAYALLRPGWVIP